MSASNVNLRTAALSTSIARKLFSVLAMGLLFTACKKDDDDGPNPPGGNPNPPAQEQGYYAAKVNMALKYQSNEDDGPTNYTLTVTGLKDSAGGKVINYRSVYDDGTSITPFIYSKGNVFTLVNTPPAELNEIIEEMKNNPNVSDFTLTGIPILQKLPANPQVNQPLEFSDPMHMGFNMEEDGETARIDMYFGFSEGKVVGIEDVTTQAGTFKNCMKVQYKSTMVLESTAGNSEHETVITQWFAKGVGLVKSEDKDGSDITTTSLIDITGK